MFFICWRTAGENVLLGSRAQRSVGSGCPRRPPLTAGGARARLGVRERREREREAEAAETARAPPPPYPSDPPLGLGFFCLFLSPRMDGGKPVMILPQVHLRKPCYDFYFL